MLRRRACAVDQPFGPKSDNCFTEILTFDNNYFGEYRLKLVQHILLD